MPVRKILFYSLLFMLFASLSAVSGQETYSAVLHVRYPGVEIQRAGTQHWLPLAMGSEAPFGNGDQLRTDKSGRAWITFWDDAQVLILSNSLYQLETLTLTDGEGTELVGRLIDGVAVHYLAQTPPTLTYQLKLHDAVVTAPGKLFATWVRPEQIFSLTVADGAVDIQMDDTITVRAGEGVFRKVGLQQVITFDPPWNAAQMRGLIEGCPGMVDTVGEVPLRVRIGPGTGYVAMGGFAFRQPVQIMAVNESRGWYRIPFLGGFGWILRSAIETDCQNLPVLPDDTIESPEYAVNASEDEIRLLEPFFGQPLLNEWFFQWAEVEETQ